MTQSPNTPGPQGPEYNQQPGAYQAGYGQPPQKKSKKKWVIGCLGLIVLAIVLFAGCAALVSGGEDVADTDPVAEEPVAEDPADEPAAEPAAAETEAAADTIVLEATADPSGTVIWGDTGSSNSESVNGTWTREVPDTGDSMYTVSVTGDIMDENSTVSCRILIDGEVVDEATGSGAMGSALCSEPLF